MRVALWCVLLAVACLTGCDAIKPSKTYNVQYCVTGSAREAGIIVATPTGPAEFDVRLPWKSPAYTFKWLDQTYVVARSQVLSGDLTVEILVNGAALKRATASGAFATARTDWLVGTGLSRAVAKQ